MSRREIRELIFKMLFRVEFYQGAEYEEQLALVLAEQEEQGMQEKDRAYMEHKCREIVAQLEQIDAWINEKSKGWKTSRMGKVELSIIRLAVYEIKCEEDIPTGVAINEAVELAKKFGTEDAPAFVNGVLAKLA
ncbi:MAG: transcription antitermination factor NusB [Roseburia sp.]